MRRKLLAVIMSAAWGLGSTACDESEPEPQPPPTSVLPSFIVPGSELTQEYPGTDGDNQPDLLTSGLGANGIAGAAPGYADPNHPTWRELRANTVYNNYRGLVDITSGGGYGRLFGPNVTPDGSATSLPGKIPGMEYLAFASEEGGQRVGLMVQVPRSFDAQRPCIVAAPSSGSRGLYGAIGTAGDWGLKRGCAVAYTDKGGGTGYQDLETNTGYGLDGLTRDLKTQASEATFQVALSEEKRLAYNSTLPNRIATQHAHSRQNPQASWGRHVLQSVEYALHVLNRQFNAPLPDGAIPATFTAENTLVIATSVSNGGGASLRAAEADTSGLIDGVVAGEPNVQPVFDASLRLRQGSGTEFQEHSRSLLELASLVSLYQPCASRAAALAASAPLNSVSQQAGEARCQSLVELGLLPGLTGSSTVEERAQAAQVRINAAGILPEQNVLQPAHYALLVPQGILVTYANQFGRFGVEDNLCGFSFASTDATTGQPVATSASRLASLAALSNGQPANAGINLVYNLGANGPVADNTANLVTSRITSRNDLNLDGALCWRALATGVNPLDGVPLSTQPATLGAYTVTRAQYEAVQAGISQTLSTGDLHGKPAIIVTGRSDGFLPLNHASRPYYALNQKLEGTGSQLRYYEVTNAHHLDSLNANTGFDSRFIPLDYYYFRALDLMFARLQGGGELPPSQVVHTTPRRINSSTGKPEDLTVQANLPALSAQPAAGDVLSFNNGLLTIPE
ncbi:D-(-)-3-hydroxybutyrate oligomer hydrolase [Hyalangium versicolor]|uniref:D-(-)-3-hydroxybutyrate oligomer hydrolase n=1 Tax=Hyalangium versicolor TaxID=2861190 RepID=UPI001CD0312E|nr:D-(-)-3-hydroxybutyrate oligomer hydrolase [Hyalangium versicolor]